MNPIFNKAKDRAKNLLEDRPNLLRLVKKAEALSGHINHPRLGQSIRLLRAWGKREYKEVPWKSLLTLTAGLIYLVNPMDLVPDFIAGAGFIDDLAVLKLVFNSMAHDLDKFLVWEQEKNSEP